jgi:hypothetical protein
MILYGVLPPSDAQTGGVAAKLIPAFGSGNGFTDWCITRRTSTSSQAPPWVTATPLEGLP